MIRSSLFAATMLAATLPAALAQTPAPIAPKVVVTPPAVIAAPVAAAAAAAVSANLTDCTQRIDLKKTEAACKLLAKEAGSDRAKMATAYTGLAAAAEGAKDLKGALKQLGWALAASPKDAALWAKRGDIRAALGQKIRSAADYSVALKYDPKNTTALLGRMGQYRLLGSLPNTVKDADAILALDPKSSVAMATRAYANQRMGKDADAAKDAEEALKLDPKSALAYAARGFAKLKTDKVAAVADLKKAIEFDPKLTAAADAIKKAGG
jgi:tetratricopeptide (TPR) repeat protein